eukprot:2619777-Pleurochrysis_carterae.AAC.1
MLKYTILILNVLMTQQCVDGRHDYRVQYCRLMTGFNVHTNDLREPGKSRLVFMQKNACGYLLPKHHCNSIGNTNSLVGVGLGPR